MKNKLWIFLTVAALITGSMIFISCSTDGGKEPWTVSQLMEPSELAAILNNPKAEKPLIYSVGFEADIKGSYDMGPVKDDDKLQKFKDAVSKLPRNAKIVIYCGCCPFEHCPNIRPAFKVLSDLGFTNRKLLNLSHNLRVDWLAKGYPVN